MLFRSRVQKAPTVPVRGARSKRISVSLAEIPGKYLIKKVMRDEKPCETFSEKRAGRFWKESFFRQVIVPIGKVAGKGNRKEKSLKRAGRKELIAKKIRKPSKIIVE